MGLPNYKFIQLNSSDQRMIHAQLKQIKFDQGPYVFIVKHLEEKQTEAIINIEKYLVKFSISMFPYPVYIVGESSEYKGKILLVNEKEELPKFFNIKTRPLGTKENAVMNKVDLKRANLKNIRSVEYLPIIKEYTRTHKLILEIEKENEFLEQVLYFGGNINV